MEINLSYKERITTLDEALEMLQRIQTLCKNSGYRASLNEITYESENGEDTDHFLWVSVSLYKSDEDAKE